MGAALAVVAGLVVLAPGQAEAATTLVVNNSPFAGCSDTPTGSGQPYCTISAAAAHAAAGDTVQVMRGTYPERVDVGTAQQGVTFLAPTGATVDGGGTRTYGFDITAADVTVDGFTVSNQTEAGIYVSGASAARITGVAATGSAVNGIKVTSGTGAVVTNSSASGNASVGILLQGCSTCTVRSSQTFQNQHEGVSIQGGSGDVVENVTSYKNDSGYDGATTREAPGINVTSWTTGPATNILVQRNVSYGNDDSGIQIYGGSQNVTVRRNLTYDNGDHGIDFSMASSGNVVSNTALDNFAAGINIESNGTTGSAAVVRNNLAADNGDGPATPTESLRTRGDIRVDTLSSPNSTIDHDLVFDSSGQTVLTWGTTTYTSLAAFQQAVPSQETHGVQGDPKLDGNHAPGAGSPAVDASDVTAPGWTANDLNGSAPVDDPAVADTGVGNPPYADLGAIERTNVATADVPPTARLTAFPSTILEGGQVLLIARASFDPDGAISGYAFDCGNGTQARVSWLRGVATCTYPTAGSYTAQVTVTDNQGATGTAAAAVTVNPAGSSRCWLGLWCGSTQWSSGGGIWDQYGSYR